jgi:hypothetical protein
MRRFAVSALMVWLSVVSYLRAADDPAAATDEAAAERLRILKAAAAAYELTSRDEADKAYTLTPEPLLHYSNPVRADVFSDGAMFVWCDGERPVAAASLSIRAGENITREFSALSEERLECSLDGVVIWTPESAGLLRQAFPDSPNAAGSAPLRLTQMRTLARRFSGDFRLPQAEDPTELRLVSQPVHRYSDDQLGIVDGAMFCMGEANDPELLILIELVKDDGDADPGWRYSLARMTSIEMRVRLDDAEVWSTSFYWRGPRSPSDPYIEAKHGPYPPPEAPLP